MSSAVASTQTAAFVFATARWNAAATPSREPPAPLSERWSDIASSAATVIPWP